LFGGRILANRGLDKLGKKVTYSNCYVLPAPEDNIESIFDTAKYLARTFSYSGGVGIDISKLRPNGMKVHNAAETTTGSTSFMDLYSKVTEVIGARGRRGALMLSILCTHPDLMDFIEIKNDLDKVTKANISIRILDNFMRAVKENKDWELYFDCKDTGERISKTVKAKDVFHKICYNNWNMAEPGALYWDTINNWSILSEDDEFEFAGTNP
jgi:ribonucleoside-diphosphate reductase alpha chain